MFFTTNIGTLSFEALSGGGGNVEIKMVSAVLPSAVLHSKVVKWALIKRSF